MQSFDSSKHTLKVNVLKKCLNVYKPYRRMERVIDRRDNRQTELSW